VFIDANYLNLLHDSAANTLRAMITYKETKRTIDSTHYTQNTLTEPLPGNSPAYRCNHAD
jgi:hypothetical protein